MTRVFMKGMFYLIANHELGLNISYYETVEKIVRTNGIIGAKFFPRKEEPSKIQLEIPKRECFFPVSEQYPGIIDSIWITLYDIYDCAIYLLAHELRHYWQFKKFDPTKYHRYTGRTNYNFEKLKVDYPRINEHLEYDAEVFANSMVQKYGIGRLRQKYHLPLANAYGKMT